MIKAHRGLVTSLSFSSSISSIVPLCLEQVFTSDRSESIKSTVSKDILTCLAASNVTTDDLSPCGSLKEEYDIITAAFRTLDLDYLDNDGKLLHLCDFALAMK